MPLSKEQAETTGEALLHEERERQAAAAARAARGTRFPPPRRLLLGALLGGAVVGGASYFMTGEFGITGAIGIIFGVAAAGAHWRYRNRA
jgi:predicted lipid-binding transport protein (Tim44 family)